MQYNEEQQALIDAPIDEIVVGASAAGSGKSTTLVGRAKKILTQYPSGQVMLISFTRNAAEDLRTNLWMKIPCAVLSQVHITLL